MILYGSKALKNIFPHFKREPFDIDWLLSEEEYDKLEDLIKNRSGQVREEFSRIPVFDKYTDYNTPLTANHLYTLKVSHIFWKIKWEKNIYDIVFLKEQNCQLIPELFNELYAYWCVKHKKKFELDFNKPNEDFFKDAVTREHKHDDLHEIVKVHEFPMFKYIKEDLDKAEISENLFNKLSFADKLLVVQEEACVLAFERYIINNERMHYRSGYSAALKDLILRLTPLWLGVFIVENYKQLIIPHLNYKEKIKKFYEKKL